MTENNVKLNSEKLLTPMNGFIVLFLTLFFSAASVYAFVYTIARPDRFTILIIIAASVCLTVCFILMCGLKTVNPNEAAVYVLFGNYYGTIAKPGFFFINPFCSIINPTVGRHQPLSRKVSLKATTLDNNKQKINDREGNPIDIGVVVIWRIVNATKAVFEVDNYNTYISVQCDAAMRNVARKYPYDISDNDEKSLRGSSSEVADELRKELQSRVEIAGIEIIETRISHLAYAQEIAAAMLQRQQADAVIAARQKIVEGAVGMVEMALNKLSEREVVNLDDERKAAMVSNLLIVLCGGKDPQPVINSGSIY